MKHSLALALCSTQLSMKFQLLISKKNVCGDGHSLAITSTGPVGLWFCGVHVRENMYAQPGSGACFMASQKTGQWLKVSSDRKRR